MTVRNINQITNQNTFGQWKNTTNELIVALGNVVTLGGPTANNDSEVYISGDITTTTQVVTDTIVPLDDATNRIDMPSLVRMYGQELEVAAAGAANAIQFRYGDSSDEESWAIGPVSPDASHNALRISGYYPGGVGVSPVTSYLEIYRSDTATANGDPIPGLITAENLVLDDRIFPEEIRFSNVETASTWKNARTIYFSDQYNTTDNTQPEVPIGNQGDVAGQITIDGSGDAVCYLRVRNNSHNHNEQYYTKAQIEANYDTVVSNDTRYIRVKPDVNPNAPAEYLISNVEYGGFRLFNDTPIYWGNLDQVKTDYRPSISSWVHEQDAGNVRYILRAGQIVVSDGTATKYSFDVASGNLTVKGDVIGFGSPSDKRLKENIEVIPNALNKVSQLSGYTFNYIDKPDTPMTGLIAQELQAVLPEAVFELHPNDVQSETEEQQKLEPGHMAIRYGNVVGLLVEAIKELKAEIEELKSGSA